MRAVAEYVAEKSAAPDRRLVQGSNSLFRRELQKGSVLAVHLEKSDADCDALHQKPMCPSKRLFVRGRLSFQSNGAAIPSLAACELVGAVNS